MGTATVGSSEAIMLGLLAHKWTWRKRRQAGRQTDRIGPTWYSELTYTRAGRRYRTGIST